MTNVCLHISCDDIIENCTCNSMVLSKLFQDVSERYGQIVFYSETATYVWASTTQGSTEGYSMENLPEIILNNLCSGPLRF